MPNYTFLETMQYFAERLNASLPMERTEEGLEMSVDKLNISLKPNLLGGLSISMILGLMLQPIRESHLRDLLSSNFLGVNTGGCTLAFDEAAVTLYLKAETSQGTPPEENWEWLHRLVCVAREWMRVLALWEEFVPLAHLTHSDSTLQKGKKG